MRKFFAYLRPYLASMCLGLLIKFTGTIMDLLLPWILAYMIDTVVPQQELPLILKWGGIMVLCSIIALVANIVANRMAARVARDTTERIRHDLYRKISYLSSKQVDEFTVPSLISRLTSDTYNIHHLIGMMQRIGIRAPILILGGILVTLTLDPVLTLVLVALLPLITLLVYLVSKKGLPLYQILQQTVDSLIRIARENITGIRVVKALSKTDYEKGRFRTMNQQVADREKRVGLTMAVTNPMMNLLLNLGLTLVVLTGAYRVQLGLTQSGKIIAFLTYFTLILNAMLTISRIFVIASKGGASFQRIAEVLDTPEGLTLYPEDRIETPYHVSFDQVSFSYHQYQENLSQISFHLKRGETLGIIGATGSGKSTIIKLLMRFYDGDEGTIRINGRNVRSIPSEELHTLFGIVFQNDVLFADTIGENIDFGRGLSPEAVFFSSQLAQAAEFIESLPDRWEHRLTVRGTNLSGGQKQRVLISRALAGNPEILVLDDSSSALDYRTDASLRKSLGNHFKGTTKIIVAQRVSSIKHADHILVLEEGKTLGYGTHEELLASCPEYREISQSQMGGRPDGRQTRTGA